jgi:hypothetical protein
LWIASGSSKIRRYRIQRLNVEDKWFGVIRAVYRFGGRFVEGIDMKKAMGGFVNAALATLVLATAADAQERPCSARWRISWEHHMEGRFAARAGSACRVRYTVGTFSNVTTISSAEIIERPRNGAAVTGNDGSIRYQPKPGFTGKDSMTVRYTGIRDNRVKLEGTVTFSIDVF